MVPDITLRQQHTTPPQQRPPLEHRSVTATLISRGATMPGCGTLMVETTMVFADILADNATLNVRVPCAEMARAMYSQTAGNAPVLHEQMPYRLELSGRGGTWHADRIDVPPPLRADPDHYVFCRNIAEPGCGLPLRRESTRPAIADRMCHDVWGPNCGPRR